MDITQNLDIFSNKSEAILNSPIKKQLKTLYFGKVTNLTVLEGSEGHAILFYIYSRVIQTNLCNRGQMDYKKTLKFH